MGAAVPRGLCHHPPTPTPALSLWGSTAIAPLHYKNSQKHQAGPRPRCAARHRNTQTLQLETGTVRQR